MAERIARNAMDDIRYQLKMAGNGTAELEEKMKLQQVQERLMDSGKLQVEPETSQDSPANTSPAAEDYNEIHAKCQRERAQLIAQFQELCKTTGQQHADKQAAVEAAHKAKLEALHKLKECYIETLEGKLIDNKNRLEALQKEIEQNARLVETAVILKDRLRAREDELDQLQLQFEEQAVNIHAETSRTNVEQQQELQDAEAELLSLRSEIAGLRTENKCYEEKYVEMRDEIAELGIKQDHQNRVEKHLSENNERLLMDLQEEQMRCGTAVAECDELKVQLAETEKALHEIAESKTELQEEYDSFKYESASAVEGAVQQLMEFQTDAERLIAEVEEHARNIFGRDQRIECLECDIELLRGRNIKLTSQNERLQASKKVPRSQPVDGLVQKPALEFLSRSNNNRSVSIASQISLADELDPNSSHSDQDSSADMVFMAKHVELDFSGVEYIIDDAPYHPATPHLTVTVGDAIATTQHAREDSPQSYSPVDLVSTVEPPRRSQRLVDGPEHMVAVFAPIPPVDPALAISPIIEENGAPYRPRPTSLASSTIISVESDPIEMNAVSQRLTMHVFKQPVIRIDAESGRVCVTDPHADRLKYEAYGSDTETLLKQAIAAHWSRGDTSTEPPPPYECGSWVAIVLPEVQFQHRAAPIVERRSPLDLYPASSGGWPIGDDPDDQHAVSVATQTTCSASDSPTVFGGLPDPFVKSPSTISSTHAGRSGPNTNISLLLPLLIFGICPTSLLLLLGIFLVTLSTLLRLYSAITKPDTTVPGRGFNPTIHYTLHLLMLPLALVCWRFWSQVHAWELANGVGFGEGFGDTYDNFGPYGGGHYILSQLPLNWLSADSQLPARAVEVITSTVSAFEGLIGFGPTPSF